MSTPYRDDGVPLIVEAVEVDGAPHVVLVGEVDMASRGVFAAAVRRVVDEGAAAVTIDMTAVSFIDSAGLAVLAEHLGAGVDITLLRPQRPVRRALEISGLNERVTIVDVAVDANLDPTPD
jgi:anti-anti-sigma factor